MNMSGIVCRIVIDEKDLTQCFAIRQKIFVDEQKLFEHTDRDAQDETAIHIAALMDNKIIGTVRIYCEDDVVWWGGRLAVVKQSRGKAGRLLIKKATETVKGKKATCFRANVQRKNVAFFKTLKWRPVGEEFLLNNKPHQMMEADLDE